MMIPEHEIFVHYIDHLGSDEAVTVNEDGSYSVFLDPQLSPEARKKRYEHALEHIKSLDFEKENVQEIEAQTHKIETPISSEAKIENLVRPTARKRKYRRRSTEKQWKEAEGRRAFMSRYDPDYALKQWENERLYGGL